MRGRRAEREPIYGGVDVEFLGEQSGETERRFTAAVAEELAQGSAVQRAYLARVRYAEIPRQEIALCLAGREDERVFEVAQRIFWALFPTGQHLDIFFVTEVEERRLAAVCGPFYGRPFER